MCIKQTITKKKIKNSYGFTLIEILATIVIIGILATIAYVNYNNSILRSRDERRKLDLETIRTALEMYKANNDYYPNNLDTLITPRPSPYLQQIPKDPSDSTGTTYKYGYNPLPAGCTTTNNCTDYTIGAIQEILNSTCTTSVSCGTVNCQYCLGPNGKK
ncbi:MAG: hypothetical protein KatS3mg090_0915 [Patescibacteria group bacterium]|nr:MAG: hypothetical protein KatS3mg090_0915 [Patescibacteria group bacterium]